MEADYYAGLYPGDWCMRHATMLNHASFRYNQGRDARQASRRESASLKFEKVVKRSPRLGDTQYFLSEDTHNMIESCVRYQAE